ncbi:MAG TPA: hypothetical protein VG253_06860 [Streptosporangiaceae bacterium]|jgi:hypothetical protein|nr:hypothetical protein [Streptosporangiaceae bacterium]
MKGRQPNPLGESLSSREKRVMSVVGIVVLLAMAGVGVWAFADHGSYGRSSNGCVNITTASSTGGAIMHACGARARSLCVSAFQQHDTFARLARPQCRLAGIAPAHS